MASPITWPGGFGGTGVDTATATNNFCSAATIWLDSTSGSDSNAGTEAELPKATLASAVSVAAADSVICVASGHTETVSSAVTLSLAGLRVLGYGTGSSRPRFTLNHATADMLTVSAAYTKLENLYFVAPAQSATGYDVNISATGCQVLNCSFEGSAYNATAVMTCSSSAMLIDSCTFTATGTRPPIAVLISGTGAGTIVTDTTFAGGSSLGFTDHALKVTGANTELVLKNITLSGKADIGITVTGSKYQLIGITASSQSRIVLTA